MNDPGTGTGSPGGSDGSSAPWQSSLSSSSLFPPAGDASTPNPFSREASQPADGLGAASEPQSSPAPDPAPASYPSAPAVTESWPTYPPAAPYADPSGTPSYSAAARSEQPAPQPPGYDPQPVPPYPSDPGWSTPQAGAYGSNPYAPAPYQPSYGTVSPYGVAPVPHPQTTTGLVLGIVGLVGALSCGVGGLVGIGGIVLGLKARKEIDAEPGRYSGRSAATAAFALGIIGVSLFAALVVILILAVALGWMGQDS